MLLLEAGRSQLGIHETGLRSAALVPTVCNKHSLVLFTAQAGCMGPGNSYGPSPRKLWGGPGLKGLWRKWLQYVLKAQRNPCNWFKDILSLQRMPLMSLAGVVSLWTYCMLQQRISLGSLLSSISSACFCLAFMSAEQGFRRALFNVEFSLLQKIKP